MVKTFLAAAVQPKECEYKPRFGNRHPNKTNVFINLDMYTVTFLLITFACNIE